MPESHTQQWRASGPWRSTVGAGVKWECLPPPLPHTWQRKVSLYLVMGRVRVTSHPGLLGTESFPGWTVTADPSSGTAVIPECG